MKLFRALVLLAWFLGPLTVLASGPDDDYVGIYNLIQRGDALNERGQPDLALAKYSEAQNALVHFEASYPDWNQKIVNYRLRYLATQISEMSNRIKSAPALTNEVSPVTNTPAAEAAPGGSIPSVTAPLIVAAPPTNASLPVPIPTAPLADSEIQIKALQEQINRMGQDNASLQAKLKEAFAARPAAVSPEELSKAQDRILELQKQNDLLQASLAESKNRAPGAAGPVSEKLKLELAEANRKIKELSAANASLQSAKPALSSPDKSRPDGNGDIVALKSENEFLKKNLADLQAREAFNATAGSNSAAKLQEAQARLAVLLSEKEVLQKEKTALENRVKDLSQTAARAATNPPAPPENSPITNPGTVDPALANRIAQLETQRAELQKSLDAATRDVAGRKKGKILAARMDELTREVAGLKAHIVLLEAGSVPYTPDELELMSKPATVLIGASVHHTNKIHKEPSPAAVALIQEAQSLFVAQKYDQAEQKYETVLAMDPTNVLTLADLASVQLEAGHLAEAEQNLKAALAIDPEDDYSLYVLGKVKFQQKDYDGALNALGRAVEIAPQNADIRNFVGLALSEKGLQSEAETAFRRAIQLNPDFADAHMNLAVVYAAQKPPLIQLAKWHYQKALAIGHAPNPALEKMIDNLTQAAATQVAH